MEALLYAREVVLERLKRNRDKHKRDYDEAYEGFKEAVIDTLKKHLELAESGKEYNLSLGLVQPVHHLKNYDRAIAMFSLSSQDQIELSEIEFTQYVLDNWTWSDTFKDSMTLYGNTKLWKTGLQ